MRFSRRTAWDRSPNDMAHLLEAGAAPDVLDLTCSNPTRAGLAADPRELAAALADDGNARYEPDPLGMPAARETLAAWLARRGVDATPERIILTASTSEAYSHLFKLACDPGDAVMIPSPGYPLFDLLARLDSVETASYHLRLQDDGWRLDVDALAASLPERARAALVVSPNNPTGSHLRDGEARELCALARERGMLVVSDEVFGDFPHPGAAPRADVREAGARQGALAVVLSGLSKACGLPQLKLGWMLLGGPDAVVDEARARLELVADTYLSVGTPVQRGLGPLLALGDAFRERAQERLCANLATLRAALDGREGRALPSDGGWSSVIALPEDASEQRLANSLVRDERVLVHPGWLFNLPFPSLVVSLLTDERTFRRGMERVAARI